MQKNSNMNQPQQLIVANILEDLLEKLPIEYDDSDEIIVSPQPILTNTFLCIATRSQI